LEQLVTYLLNNIIIDFQGDLTLDILRDFLREDKSPAAKRLLAKMVADGGVDDMLICVADCLREQLSTGIRADVMRDQINIYSDS